jgi:hypothetical protein
MQRRLPRRHRRKHRRPLSSGTEGRTRLFSNASGGGSPDRFSVAAARLAAPFTSWSAGRRTQRHLAFRIRHARAAFPGEAKVRAACVVSRVGHAGRGIRLGHDAPRAVVAGAGRRTPRPVAEIGRAIRVDGAAHVARRRVFFACALRGCRRATRERTRGSRNQKRQRTETGHSLSCIQLHHHLVLPGRSTGPRDKYSRGTDP